MEERAICEIKRKGQEPVKFTYANLLSYADVADLAEKATSISFQRDVANDTNTATGKIEILEAINESFEEKLHLDHTDSLVEAIKSVGEDYAGLKVLRQMRK